MGRVRLSTSEDSKTVKAVLILMARHRSGLPFYEALPSDVLALATELAFENGGEIVGEVQDRRWEACFPSASAAIRVALESVLLGAGADHLTNIAGIAAAIGSGEVWGECSDLLARVNALSSLVESEQILVDAATRELARFGHSEDLEFYRYPRERDVDEREGTFYQVLHRELRQAFREFRSAETRRIVLPTRSSSFVGRSEEIEELSERLAEHHVVTVLGPAGIGKSSLVLRVVQERIEEYADGVQWIDLREFSPEQDVLRILANTLNIPVGANWTLDEAIAYHCGGRESLLIFDNADEFAPQLKSSVARLRKRWPEAQLLFTSSVPLQLQNEARYRVGSLAFSAEDPFEADVIRLFTERAQRANPEFRCHTENLEAIGEIGRRLDGNPLAIELASALTASWTPKQIIENWDEFGLDSSLDGAIARTVSLLDPADQSLFRALSIIQGDISTEAAKSVGPPQLSAKAVRASLGRLQEVNLVEPVEPQLEDGPVFRLRGQPRAVAARMLSEADERQATEDRHTEWICRYFESSSQKLSSPDQDIWAQKYILRLKDLDAASLRLIKGAPSTQTDSLLIDFSYIYFRRPELWTTLPAILDYLESSPDLLSAERVRLIFMVGVALDAHGEYHAARRWFLRSLRLSKALGEPTITRKALMNLGRLEHRLGSPKKAFRYARLARRLERAKDPRGRALALLSDASALTLDGKFDEAGEVLQEASKFVRPLKDRYLSVYLLSLQSAFHKGRGEYKQALGKAAEAAEIALANDLRAEIGEILVGASETFWLLGDQVKALCLSSCARGVIARQEGSTQYHLYVLLERVYADSAAALGRDADAYIQTWNNKSAKEALSTILIRTVLVD